MSPDVARKLIRSPLATAAGCALFVLLPAPAAPSASDDDAYYAVWGQVHGPHGHGTEMSFRAAHLFATPVFSVEGEVGYSFRYNRSLIRLHAGNPGLPEQKEMNIGIRLAGRWLPAWSRGR